MTAQNKIAAGPGTVEMVKDSADDEGKSLFQYTGEGYLPLGAQTVRADTLVDAIKEFRYALEDFGYNEGNTGPEDTGSNCDCDSCLRARD